MSRNAISAFVGLAIVVCLGVVIWTASGGNSSRRVIREGEVVSADSGAGNAHSGHSGRDQSASADGSKNSKAGDKQSASRARKNATPAPASAQGTPASDGAAAGNASAKTGADAAAEDPLDGLTLEQADLLDWGITSKLIKKYGSAAELYQNLPEDKKGDLITSLWMEDKLRDEIANLLPLESDSAVRADMIMQTTPRDFASDSEELDENGEPKKDKELMDLLDKPTNTPMDAQEWLARLQLASELDNEYALKWIQDAKNTCPDKTDVMMKASSLTLRIGEETGEVNEREMKDAEEYVWLTLHQNNGSAVSADQRIEAYYALLWGPNRSRSLDFYRQQLQWEPDAQARNTLSQLISLMEAEKAAP